MPRTVRDQVRAELPPQVSHVDVDDVRPGIVVALSNAAEQLLTGEHLTGWVKKSSASANLRADDDRQPLLTRFDAATGVARATRDRDLDAGRHIATVIVVHESGRLHPEAIISTTTAP
jgi:hypothetical protein